MFFKQIKEINKTVDGDFTQNQVEILQNFGWRLVQCENGEGVAEKNQYYSNGDCFFIKLTQGISDIADPFLDLNKNNPTFLLQGSDFLALQGSPEWIQDEKKLSTLTFA